MKPAISSNREFSALVNVGVYPEQVSVPLDEPFTNQNGLIQNLILEQFSSAAIIYSKPGSVRANHYHKTDWHYAYVILGSVEYHWRGAGSKESPQVRTFKDGEMFFTPPMVEHAMFFPQGGTIITLARNIRDAEHHEEDVVRVKLIEIRQAATGLQAFYPAE